VNICPYQNVRSFQADLIYFFESNIISAKQTHTFFKPEQISSNPSKILESFAGPDTALGLVLYMDVYGYMRVWVCVYLWVWVWCRCVCMCVYVGMRACGGVCT